MQINFNMQTMVLVREFATIFGHIAGLIRSCSLYSLQELPPSGEGPLAVLFPARDFRHKLGKVSHRNHRRQRNQTLETQNFLSFLSGSYTQRNLAIRLLETTCLVATRLT